MEVSSDPYELKLYQMFESCDTESCGLLNQDALRRLCTLLELRDKGAVLIENLAVSGKNQHVSFECFKEALLNFLGTELDGKEVTSVTTSKFSHPQIQNATQDCERVLVISDEVETYVEHEHDLSDREVSPKLVMGTKKYGRRSRPQQHAVDEFSLSDSEDNEYREENRCTKHNGHIVQRSSSHTDIPGTRCRRFTSLNGNKLKRCSSLPAQKTPKAAIAKSKAALGLKKNTVSSKENQLGSSVESLDAPNLMETISRHTIMDIWEHANISNSKGILLALGCDEDEINVAHLNKVLEEELSNIHDDGESTLWRAALALQSAELSTLRHALRQLHQENLKLRADSKDANRRVTMLAVEIDERHATLEDTSKKEIKMLEQRHAAAVRELTTRMANDREHWTNLTSRLEARIKSFEQDEIRLKTELEFVRKENTELDGEQQKLSKQVNELIEKNTQLNREINLKQNSTCEEHNCSTTEKTSQDEVLQLIEKIDVLQLENKNLRDKSDELVAEIENLNFEMQRLKAKGIKKSSIATGNSVQGTEEIVQLEENEQGNSLSAVKRRGDSPSKTRMTEESPRLGKLRRCGNETGGSENSDTSGEWMALNSELQRLEGGKPVQNIHKSTDVSLLKEQITALEMQVKNLQTCSTNTSVEDRCKELETSLEQMQRAYEDCEDYWQSKLSEERQLFEKERQIYEEEQQESDKKFTELMEKVREYEEQFSKDGRLSPIEEKDTLEQQYADLEAEAEEIRENSRRIFQEKSKEIETLQIEIEDLRLRLGESVEILTGACELSSENAVNSATNINANAQSSASSPISYLWHQSTIQEPNKLYQSLESGDVINNSSPTASTNKSLNRNNLSTSATAIFSTTPIDSCLISVESSQTISPIQKPKTNSKPLVESEVGDCETSSTSSERGFETQSITSTQSVHRSQGENAVRSNVSSSQDNYSSSGLKEELKRLKFFELSLKEQIKDLSLQRDGLVMELQQLQEARPVLEKAYARTAHPTLIQRVNQLELKNRHLQNVIKQQQQYTESLMQQSWRQHQLELTDLHGRIEAQTVMLAEQTQRLQNADLLVKDLYVENSNLASTVQRLEQQRARTLLMHQQRQTLNTLPGMP